MLTICDLLLLLSHVQHLFEKVREAQINCDEIIDSLDKMDNFTIKIKRESLQYYLHQVTSFSKTQIKHFLGSISYKISCSQRVNLWKTPLIETEEYYFVNFLPLLNPNSLAQIEHWLELGGDLLTEKGKLYEKYLARILQAKKIAEYEFKIPSLKKFKDSSLGIDEEEIDLIICLRELVVIAEIKCLSFPMEPRDYHNSMAEILKGISQVKRKMDMLKTHASHFTKELGDITGKEIIPVVITNYPIFAGQVIDGIPVIDGNLIKGYLSGGEFAAIKAEVNEELSIPKESFTYTYHKNENEFNQKLKFFLTNPLPISLLRNEHEIEEVVLTPEGIYPQIIVNRVKLHEVFPE